jgi:uncharacterized Rmd1/YagE family protein
MPTREHRFSAIAFEENLVLKDLVPLFPEATASAIELTISQDSHGDTHIYPFGAVVFHDVGPDRREAELKRLNQARNGLTKQAVVEEYVVREDPSAAKIGFEGGMLVIDHMTPGRVSVVALTVAQSAAMEYYERIVSTLATRTGTLVQRMERNGTVPIRIRPLHMFIGEAIATRTEVLEVLHLLDKPDAAWDDPGMSDIYDDLRAEFDLSDRYHALELKLGSVQEALELVLDVARDRRLVWLEATIVLLIVLEVFLSLVRH